MKKLILSSVFIVSVFASCRRGDNKKNEVVIENEINMEHKQLNFDASRRENNAHSGQYYSSVDSISHFGIGYEYVLNDSLKNRNLTLYVTCWVREAQLPVEGKISIGLSNAKEIKKWNEFGVKDANYKAGEWVQLSDSITYSAGDLQDEFIKVGVVAIKSNGSDAFDVDDLKIKYKFFK